MLRLASDRENIVRPLPIMHALLPLSEAKEADPPQPVAIFRTVCLSATKFRRKESTNLLKKPSSLR